MKLEIFSTRHKQLLFVLLVLAVILIVRLFVVTVIQNDKWSDASESVSTRSIYTTAPRGEIYDRYGRLIAGNKQSFSVRISASGLEQDELNDNISKLLKVLNKNGDKVDDDFPIKISDGKFRFTYEEEIKSWLAKNNFSTSLTAEQAFTAMRNKLGIDESLDRYSAQLEMQNTYNVYPPISVKEMKYTSETEKEAFIETYFGDEEKYKDMSAKEVFKELRKELEISKKLSDSEARKIMVVRNKIKALGYNQYMPAVVSKEVSSNTVMTIEEGGESLKGVEIVSDSKRYYPNGNTASHILGYLGKITEDEIAKNKDVGYESTAIVGKEGIEEKYESVLRGINGEKKVQVNAQGQLESVISETAPKKGKDVYLTIDLELQKHAEKALKDTIKAMQSGGSITSKYGTTPTAKAAPNAKTGAVVAIEVDTGDVLALASYPDYNPNLFAEGITEKNWEKLQSENIRDPLAAAPLYNLATMTTVQPGSTFKPVTAMAALQCGLDPYKTYYDDGVITLGGNDFACVVWNFYKQKHGAIDMFRALEVSCNYYFYDIGTGKDWYTGQSLGLKEDMSVKKITDMAEQFGLGHSTGIEIDEAVTPVPTEERKISGLKTNLSYELYAGAESYFEEEVTKNSEKLDKSVKMVTECVDNKNLTWELLHDSILPSAGVKKNKLQELSELVLYDYIPQAKWTDGDAFNISIGQGENSYSPLQMANYAATLGNKGTLNEVSLVKSVESQGSNKKAAGKKVKVDSKKYFDYVLEGMRRVVTGSGSAVSGILGNLDFEVVAKTGTAERKGKVNPESEVEYVKKYLGSIAPSLSWSSVNKEMKRLMKKYPDTYVSEDVAVRRAVMNLSKGSVTTTKLDAYKGEYDEFAWIIAMAPADDPKIAVCAMVPQGSTAANAAPIIKEVLCKYFDTEKSYTDFTITNVVQ